MNKHIKSLLVTLSILTLGFYFSGCMAVGGVEYPKPTAVNFKPKLTYTVNQEKAIAAIQTALEAKHIGISSIDKSSGIVKTDAVSGTSYLIGGGLAGGQMTRYAYTVSIRPQDAGVKISILARLESSSMGDSGSSQWTDISEKNKELTTQLENWLYEQIEANL